MNNIIEVSMDAIGLINESNARLAAANRIIAEQSALIAKCHAALVKTVETIDVQTASGMRPGRDNFNDAMRTASNAIALCEGRS